MIIKANIEDAKLLTHIALTSKAHWGYSEEQLESWKDDLTVTQKMIQEMNAFVFIFEDSIVGFYILNQPKSNSIELEFLFVLPNHIGKGIGKQLLQHAFKQAKQCNVTSITLLADPNAQTFYESQGFVLVGQKESSIPKRFLPVLKKDLK